MEYIYNEIIDSILSIGCDLRNHGICNWALTKKQTIYALLKFKENRIPVLGGDVLEKYNDEYVSTCDNWYSAPQNGEIMIDYINRSIDISINYINNYNLDNKDNIFFILVPAQSKDSMLILSC